MAHAFCQAIYERIEGCEWEELSKAKAFWTMKAANDRVEDFYDPARKDEEIGLGRSFGREHLKDPIEALDKALKHL